MNRKKSFVLYFDCCRQALGLSNEQLGILFRAILDCAEREAAGEDGLSGYEQRFPDMAPDTRMAFLFFAATIHRDTQAYAEKSANYRAAAQRRSESRREQQPAPDGELRQYVRQLQQKPKEDPPDDVWKYVD